jgi:hypothetical protein
VSLGLNVSHILAAWWRSPPRVVRIRAVEFADDVLGFAIGQGWPPGVGVGRHRRPDQFAVVLQVVALPADLLGGRAGVAGSK